VARRNALANAELYWLTTVRGDGRPHVTPLVGVWVDDGFVFCTGPDEQKTRNLESGNAVAVTTGTNTWNDGLDVVVEGQAVRVMGLHALTELADADRDGGRAHVSSGDFGALTYAQRRFARPNRH
jgi:nitroimidazol reductase NimA-like FMN-containing flavoprotein (pyridoxamine 5'-phosphate oxidase superfamily)